MVPAGAQAPVLRQFAALQAENQALKSRIRELEARLGQTSSNSSRPPSSDLPQGRRGVIGAQVGAENDVALREAEKARGMRAVLIVHGAGRGRQGRLAGL